VFDFAQQERKGRERDPWPDPNTKGGLGIRFRTEGKEGKGKGGNTLSAGEASNEKLARAAPLPCRRRDAAWKEGGRASERERYRGGRREKGGTAALGADVLCWAHPVLG